MYTTSNQTNNGEILKTLISEDYGLEGRGNWFRSDEHSSLVLDYDKGIFYYNKEGIVGDPLVYLTKIRGLSFQEAKDYLKNYNYSGTHVYTIRGSEEVVVFPELVSLFHSAGRNKECREYFYNRGLSDETIDRFQLGYYNGWNTVPFFVDGTFRNFQMRRDKPSKATSKFYKGVDPLLYNSDILKLVDKVFIVEGPIDALALMQNGIPAISTDMSGNMLPEWYVKFVNQKEIYIVYDYDSAGLSESKRVAEMLGVERCKVYNFTGFTEQKGYDPVDFFREGRTADDFLDLVYNSAKHIYEFPKRRKF